MTTTELFSVAVSGMPSLEHKNLPATSHNRRSEAAAESVPSLKGTRASIDTVEVRRGDESGGTYQIPLVEEVVDKPDSSRVDCVISDVCAAPKNECRRWYAAEQKLVDYPSSPEPSESDQTVASTPNVAPTSVLASEVETRCPSAESSPRKRCQESEACGEVDHRCKYAEPVDDENTPLLAMEASSQEESSGSTQTVELGLVAGGNEQVMQLVDLNDARSRSVFERKIAVLHEEQHRRQLTSPEPLALEPSSDAVTTLGSHTLAASAWTPSATPGAGPEEASLTTQEDEQGTQSTSSSITDIISGSCPPPVRYLTRLPSFDVADPPAVPSLSRASGSGVRTTARCKAPTLQSEGKQAGVARAAGSRHRAEPARRRRNASSERSMHTAIPAPGHADFVETPPLYLSAAVDLSPSLERRPGARPMDAYRVTAGTTNTFSARVISDGVQRPARASGVAKVLVINPGVSRPAGINFSFGPPPSVQTFTPTKSAEPQSTGVSPVTPVMRPVVAVEPSPLLSFTSPPPSCTFASRMQQADVEDTRPQYGVDTNSAEINSTMVCAVSPSATAFQMVIDLEPPVPACQPTSVSLREPANTQPKRQRARRRRGESEGVVEAASQALQWPEPAHEAAPPDAAWMSMRAARQWDAAQMDDQHPGALTQESYVGDDNAGQSAAAATPSPHGSPYPADSPSAFLVQSTPSPRQHTRDTRDPLPAAPSLAIPASERAGEQPVPIRIVVEDATTTCGSVKAETRHAVPLVALASKHAAVTPRLAHPLASDKVRLALTLFPKEEGHFNLLAANGHAPILQLKVKTSRSLETVFAHVRSKWRTRDGTCLIAGPMRMFAPDGALHWLETGACHTTLLDIMVALNVTNPAVKLVYDWDLPSLPYPHHIPSTQSGPSALAHVTDGNHVTSITLRADFHAKPDAPTLAEARSFAADAAEQRLQWQHGPPLPLAAGNPDSAIGPYPDMLTTNEAFTAPAVASIQSQTLSPLESASAAPALLSVPDGPLPLFPFSPTMPAMFTSPLQASLWTFGPMPAGSKAQNPSQPRAAAKNKPARRRAVKQPVRPSSTMLPAPSPYNPADHAPPSDAHLVRLASIAPPAGPAPIIAAPTNSMPMVSHNSLTMVEPNEASLSELIDAMDTFFDPAAAPAPAVETTQRAAPVKRESRMSAGVRGGGASDTDSTETWNDESHRSSPASVSTVSDDSPVRSPTAPPCHGLGSQDPSWDALCAAHTNCEDTDMQPPPPETETTPGRAHTDQHTRSGSSSAVPESAPPPQTGATLCKSVPAASGQNARPRASAFSESSPVLSSSSSFDSLLAASPSSTSASSSRAPSPTGNTASGFSPSLSAHRWSEAVKEMPSIFIPRKRKTPPGHAQPGKVPFQPAPKVARHGTAGVHGGHRPDGFALGRKPAILSRAGPGRQPLVARDLSRSVPVPAAQRTLDMETRPAASPCCTQPRSELSKLPLSDSLLSNFLPSQFSPEEFDRNDRLGDSSGLPTSNQKVTHMITESDNRPLKGATAVSKKKQGRSSNSQWKNSHKENLGFQGHQIGLNTATSR